jgi:ribokinase
MAEAAGPGLAVVGRPCLDLVFTGLGAAPAPGEEVIASGAEFLPGSVAAVAAAWRRWGRPAWLVTPPAQDPVGRQFASLLAGEGVSLLPAGRGACTVTCAIPWQGDRALVTRPGHLDWEVAEVADALAVARGRGAAWLHGHAALPHMAEILGAARRLGMTTSVKVSWDPAFLTSRRARGPLAAADWLFLNGREADLLCGGSDPAAVEAWRLRHAPDTTAVVTLGAVGCRWTGPAGAGAAAGRPIEAHDTTGAGDVYAAAAVWGLAAGQAATEALTAAHAAAALSTLGAGALGALPPLEAWRGDPYARAAGTADRHA